MKHNTGNEAPPAARPMPTSLTQSGREARREAREKGTLRGWWRYDVGDVRDLLAAAKYGGDELAGNLSAARDTLSKLSLFAETRVGLGCSCSGSRPLEEALFQVSNGFSQAKLDVEGAMSMLVEGRKDHRALSDQIASALSGVPTLAQIGALAGDLGYCELTGNPTVPVVRYDAPTWCRFCGSGLGQPELDQHAEAQQDGQEARPPLSMPDLERLTTSVWAAMRAGGCDDTLRHTCASVHKRGWPVVPVVAWLRAHGGHCDCEVLFNVEARVAQMASHPVD